MARAKREIPASEDEADEHLDQSTETDTLTGAIPEGVREVLRPIVSKMGWAPKEEWKRDPAEWKDELQFFEDTPKVLADLKERGERQARAAAEAIEEERRQRIRDEATKVIREADDPDERARAAERIAQSAGPPPETQAWLAKNPWFHTDPDAQAIVVRTCDDLAAQKRPISEQLEEAEKKVRRLFPEHFEAGATEQRLSDVRRQSPTPPQVQSGSRAGSAGGAKEKGWAEIPRADREAFTLHLEKAFMSRGLKREEAQAQYADGYWGTGVLHPSEREEDPWVTSKKPNPWVTRGRAR